MTPEYIAEFTRIGIVTTDLNGIAYVVFREQLPYGLSYSIILTVKESGKPAIAMPSEETHTGFTITTMLAKDGAGYLVTPSVPVYWLVIPQFNA